MLKKNYWSSFSRASIIHLDLRNWKSCKKSKTIFKSVNKASWDHIGQNGLFGQEMQCIGPQGLMMAYGLIQHNQSPTNEKGL